MEAHDTSLFLHVVGALGLAAAFGVEAVGLVGLRRATDADEALLWLRSRRWVLLIGPASIGLVLVTGIYLSVVEWGPDSWILVSLASLVALAGIGGVLTGIPMARVTRAVERASGPLSEELRRGLQTPVLTVSIMTHIAITVGIVFLMVLKPALVSSILTIVLAVGIGVAAGLVSGTRQPSPSPIGSAVPPTDAKR
jgi:hypothetical protein